MVTLSAVVGGAEHAVGTGIGARDRDVERAVGPQHVDGVVVAAVVFQDVEPAHGEVRRELVLERRRDFVDVRQLRSVLILLFAALVVLTKSGAVGVEIDFARIVAAVAVRIAPAIHGLVRRVLVVVRAQSPPRC